MLRDYEELFLIYHQVGSFVVGAVVLQPYNNNLHLTITFVQESIWSVIYTVYTMIWIWKCSAALKYWKYLLMQHIMPHTIFAFLHYITLPMSRLVIECFTLLLIVLYWFCKSTIRISRNKESQSPISCTKFLAKIVKAIQWYPIDI